jgi:hypothetical protein
MLRPLLRSAIVGTALVASASVPSVAIAQSLSFTSCAVAGVCGFVEAFFAGTFLTVRISNLDNTFGSALFTTQVTFGGPLGAAPGVAFTQAANASLVGSVSAVGTTPSNAWSYSGVGGSNVLDLSAFLNVFIEGPAPSPFRALPGDPDNGTWITTNGYVQFAADLSGVSGVNTGQIVGLEFCTQVDCASVTTPEPATFVLVATGLVGLAAVRRRRKAT